MNEEPFPTLGEPDAQTVPTTPPSPPEGVQGLSQDSQVSRKREREVSLEPVTPLAELDSARKDKQAAKKNRLGPTLEETNEPLPSPAMPVSIRADSPSPPSISHEPGNTEMLSMSPPHDVKMRHISQRVEHIGWKNGETPTPESVLQPSISRELGKVSQPPPRAVSPSPQKDEEEAPRRGSMESIINTGMSPPIPPPSTTPLTPPEDPSPTILDDSQDDNKRRSMESIISQGGTKRPRDEEEGDVNPRVAKRPSPPPEKKEEPKPAAPSTPAPASKMSGFMSYASTASPFAAVKGSNLFKAKSPAPQTNPQPFFSPNGPTGSQTAPSSPPKSESTTKRPFGASSSGPPSPKGDSTPVKRNAFTAFASAASPFSNAASGAAKRAKSPSVSGERPSSFALPSPFGRPKPMMSSSAERAKSPAGRVAPTAAAAAFTGYASGGASGFASPLATPARTPARASSLDSARKETKDTGSEGSDEESAEKNSKASFSERLRAQEDTKHEEEGKVELTEQEITTGEEDEDTLYSVRGKLFVLSSANQWKERGTGALRLNVRHVDGAGARLVMRKEAVHTLILNVPLFRGMLITIAQDPRYLRFSTIEDGSAVHYNLRVSSAKAAQELLDEITRNIPRA